MHFLLDHRQYSSTLVHRGTISRTDLNHALINGAVNYQQSCQKARVVAVSLRLVLFRFLLFPAGVVVTTASMF